MHKGYTETVSQVSSLFQTFLRWISRAFCDVFDEKLLKDENPHQLPGLRSSTLRHRLRLRGHPCSNYCS